MKKILSLTICLLSGLVNQVSAAAAEAGGKNEQDGKRSAAYATSSATVTATSVIYNPNSGLDG